MQYLKAVVLFVVMMVMLVPAASADGVKVYLQPVESAEGTLVADVMVENVTDLYGLEFQLSYDPSVFVARDADANKDGIQIQPGDFLPVEQGFLVVNEVDADHGRIAFALTLLNPAPPVSGTGTLARLSFDVLSDRAATIDITQINLVSGELTVIPTETAGLTVGEAGGMWWLAAVAIFALGFASLGAVIFMASRRQVVPVAETARPALQEQA